jgi:hypothetical protein
MHKRILTKIHWVISSQFGLYPIRLFNSIRGLPRYLIDLITFRRQFKGSLSLMPCLHDRYEEGGTTKNEYFWQDLHVARLVFEANPKKHVDIGSRIDGFVAHVASFREIEVFDVRPITSIISGILFRQADLTKNITTTGGDLQEYCDSLSCLHAIEHFGLGRYGDEIDPNGYIRGIENISKLIQTKGKFYLSTPIGIERVEFNANWIFNPKTIINLVQMQGFYLNSLTTFEKGEVCEVDIHGCEIDAAEHSEYKLGVFVFTKL